MISYPTTRSCARGCGSPRTALLLALLLPLFALAAVRIMPLGDSITEGNYLSNYRLYLQRLLVAHGVDVDFVGTLHWGADSLQDADMEGHNGWTIDQIRGGIGAWLPSTDPQIILLMIGTNDMHGYESDTLGPRARLDTLLREILVLSPRVRVFVASIPPLSYPDGNARVETYNAALPGIVEAKVKQGFAVAFVDINRLLTVADLDDGVHPNDTGFRKIAQGYYDAVVAATDSLSTGVAGIGRGVPLRMTGEIRRDSGRFFDVAGRRLFLRQDPYNIFSIPYFKLRPP